jgi:hypothetical protein
VIAETAEGRELMIARIVSVTRALPAEAGDDAMLRVALRAYLAFLSGEPAFGHRRAREHYPTASSRAGGQPLAVGLISA